MHYQVLQGDNRETLKTLPADSVDAIVTDPPYGIDFLGKAWDANVGALETYKECLRVLKPGGHILAFSAPRTYHHLAVTLEQAGFEIRDQIMWIYSSGFPKSQDIGRSIQRSLGVKEKKKHKHNVPRNGGAGDTKHYESDGQVVVTDPEAKQWEGWGTALKPAHEPICLARKPTKLSTAKNVQHWGVGALNIAATRVPFADEQDVPSYPENGWSRVGFSEQPVARYRDQKKKSDKDIYLDNMRGPMERSTVPAGAGIGMFGGEVGYKAIKRTVDPDTDLPAGRFPSNVIGEITEPYQKYFYCPKVARAERHAGYDPNNIGFQERRTKRSKEVGNNHPTVKPVELMKYLIKLITPEGGTVLDPFNGSGSTGMAAVELGYTYIGCELDANYVEISRRRIEAWHKQTHPNTYAELFESC